MAVRYTDGNLVLIFERVRQHTFSASLRQSQQTCRLERNTACLCNQIRTVDLEAWGAKRVESVPDGVIDDVLARVRHSFIRNSRSLPTNQVGVTRYP
jgi:mRNA-degrading endonuclease toxin of MazEF toxin-antitoxin module